MVRFILAEGIDKVSEGQASRETAKQIYAKYFHDSVYCLSVRSRQRRIALLWKEFHQGRKRLSEKGKEESVSVI